MSNFVEPADYTKGVIFMTDMYSDYNYDDDFTYYNDDTNISEYNAVCDDDIEYEKTIKSLYDKIHELNDLIIEKDRDIQLLRDRLSLYTIPKKQRRKPRTLEKIWDLLIKEEQNSMHYSDIQIGKLRGVSRNSVHIARILFTDIRNDVLNNGINVEKMIEKYRISEDEIAINLYNFIMHK